MTDWLMWLLRLGVAAYEAVRSGQDASVVAERLSDDVRIMGQRHLARARFDAAKDD